MEQFANNARTTLSAGINSSVTSITVNSASNFPTSPIYRIIMDGEIMLVTAGAGTTTWTVTRGAEGTTAVSHNAGATLTQIITSGGLSQYRSETTTVVGTAGETLSLTNGMCVVYQDTANARGGGAGKWYMADNAATAPVKMSRVLGIATTAISSGSSDLIFLSGPITASGLTAGPLYVGTSGATTGTKPNPSAGTQAWILPIGSAISATVMDFVPPSRFDVIAAPNPSFFQNTSTVTIETFADPVARTRRPYATRSDNIVPDPGFPICHYRFNEGPNSTALIDVMGLSNGFNAGGGATWSTDVPSALSGIATYSATFTGVVYLSNPSPFWTNSSPGSNTVTFSLATWIKRTSLGTGGFGTIFQTGTPNNNWQVGLTENTYETSNGNKLAISKTGVSESLSATAITDTTTWHHVAFTYDGSTVKFYLDGSQLTSNSYSGQTFSFSGAPAIGNNGQKLCDMRFFNFVLSSTQVSHLNSGKNTDNSTIATTTGYTAVDATPGPCIQTFYGDTSYANPDTKITFMNRLGTGGTITLGVSL